MEITSYDWRPNREEGEVVVWVSHFPLIFRQNVPYPGNINVLPAGYLVLSELNITYPMHFFPKISCMYCVNFYLNIPYSLKTFYKASGLQSCSIPGSETEIRALSPRRDGIPFVVENNKKSRLLKRKYS